MDRPLGDFIKSQKLSSKRRKAGPRKSDPLTLPLESLVSSQSRKINKRRATNVSRRNEEKKQRQKIAGRSAISKLAASTNNRRQNPARKPVVSGKRDQRWQNAQAAVAGLKRQYRNGAKRDQPKPKRKARPSVNRRRPRQRNETESGEPVIYRTGGSGEGSFTLTPDEQQLMSKIKVMAQLDRVPSPQKQLVTAARRQPSFSTNTPIGTKLGDRFKRN